MKFLHTMIRVKDLEASMKFYQDLLGLNLVNEMELEDCKLYFLADEDGQTQIELTHNFETPQGGYSQGSAFGHFAFGVDNLEEFGVKMAQMDYTWVEPPFVIENYDLKVAFICDPDGNMVEIIEG